MGTGAPLPCEEGSYSEATDLVSYKDCTRTDPGFYAPTGSKKQTKCPPGSFDARGGEGRCELCPAGKYTGKTNQTECSLCTLTSWCARGSSAPTPCPSGTVGAREGLASRGECEAP